MSKKTWVCQITGWVLIAGSITLAALAGTDTVLTGESLKNPVYYITALLLGLSGICLAACSFIFFRKHRKKKKNISMFEILSKHNGQITPQEFADESGLNTDESRHTLDDMYKNGICRLHVTETGLLIYYFPDFEFDGIVTKT